MLTMADKWPDLIVMMYHSVSGPAHDGVTGSFPLPFNRFITQIETLQKAGYMFGHVDDLANAAQSGQRVAFVTSDDGTADWCENALPYLESQSIPSHLGIISGIWATKPIYPLTHIVQIILKTRSTGELNDLANRLCQHLSDRQLRYINDHYHYEDLRERRLIKGAINLVLPHDIGQELVLPLSNEEKELLETRFSTPDQLRPFTCLSIGNHTRTHTTLDEDALTYFSNEVTTWSIDTAWPQSKISNVFTLPITGRPDASYDQLECLLRDAGYKAMFTGSGFWDKKSFTIPRIDAIHFDRWF
jgi:hypothetical protein